MSSSTIRYCKQAKCVPYERHPVHSRQPRPPTVRFIGHRPPSQLAPPQLAATPPSTTAAPAGPAASTPVLPPPATSPATSLPPVSSSTHALSTAAPVPTNPPPTATSAAIVPFPSLIATSSAALSTSTAAGSASGPASASLPSPAYPMSTQSPTTTISSLPSSSGPFASAVPSPGLGNSLGAAASSASFPDTVPSSTASSSIPLNAVGPYHSNASFALSTGRLDSRMPTLEQRVTGPTNIGQTLDGQVDVLPRSPVPEDSLPRPTSPLHGDDLGAAGAPSMTHGASQGPLPTPTSLPPFHAGWTAASGLDWGTPVCVVGTSASSVLQPFNPVDRRESMSAQGESDAECARLTPVLSHDDRAMDLDLYSDLGLSSDGDGTGATAGRIDPRRAMGRVAAPVPISDPSVPKHRGEAERRRRRKAAMADPKVHTSVDKQIVSHKGRTDTLLFRAREMAHSCFSDVILLAAHDRILSKSNSTPRLPCFEHYFSHDVRDAERKIRCAQRYKWQDQLLQDAFGSLADDSDPNWPTSLRLSGMIYELFGCIVQDKQEFVLAANTRGMQATVRRADEAMAKAKLKEEEAEAKAADAKLREEEVQAKAAAVEQREDDLKAREADFERQQSLQDQMAVENWRASGVPEHLVEQMLAGMRAARRQVRDLGF